jgi:hypothetical protein
MTITYELQQLLVEAGHHHRKEVDAYLVNTISLLIRRG